jgi:hypothetical protein
VSLSRIYLQLLAGGGRPPGALSALALLRLARAPWSGASA